MKVHYIAVIWGLLKVEVEAEQTRFQRTHPALSLLYDFETNLHNCPQRPRKTDPRQIAHYLEGMVEALEEEADFQAINELFHVAALVDNANQACELAFGNPYQACPPAVQEQWCERLRKAIKTIRQQYWLSWLEDYYCKKIATAFQVCANGIAPNNTDEHLFIVAMPEFIFSDFRVDMHEAFYESVGRQFIHGLLPKDMPRTAAPMQTLAQLTATLSGPRRQLVIFAGTIVWKKFSALQQTSLFYNMAPVFFGGSCCFVWEKQMISGLDGKSHNDQHRHPVAFGREKNVETHGALMAGALTLEILAGLGYQAVQPVFQLTIFHRPVRFAVTICLDFIEPAILGNVRADIHILMAAEMIPYNTPEKLSNIRTTNIFLYCDMGFNGVAAMYSLHDASLWPHPPYEWTSVDTTAMQNRLIQDRNSAGGLGMYIASNVEDL